MSASIQSILKIEPIEGSENVELAYISDYQCVVEKGEFREGQTVIFFRSGSFLPMRREFSFLRDTSYKKSTPYGEGYLLQTRMIRGVESQGILRPLAMLPQKAEFGDDVSDMFGVIEWN